MEIKEIKNRADIDQFEKLNALYTQFGSLLMELRSKELPNETVLFINDAIDRFNSVEGSEKILRKEIRSTQSSIINLLANEHKLVTKNHYRNIWLAVGMAAFGIAVQRNQLGGIAIGFAGTIWLIQAQQSASILSSEPNPSIFIPSLLLVIATICYGISVNITREKLRGLKSPVIAACSLGLVAMPASLIFITGDIPHLIASHPDGLRGLAAVTVLAAFGTAGALVLFNQLIAWTSAVTAASVTYIIPLFAALWGWWDGEQLNAQHLAAGGCILLGVWLTNRKAKR